MWNIVVVMLKKQFTIDGCIEGLQNSFDHLLNRPVTNFIQWSDMGQLNKFSFFGNFCRKLFRISKYLNVSVNLNVFICCAKLYS